MESRRYSIASHVIEISLEEPWNFMEMSEEVGRRVSLAASGQALESVVPIRAGDDEPSRTFVTCPAELPSEPKCGMLDFSQYEPFRYSGEDAPLCTVHVHASCEEDLAAGTTELYFEKGELPYFRILRRGEDVIIELMPLPDKVSAYLLIPEDRKVMHFYPVGQYGPSESYGYRTLFQLNTAIMISFAAATASHNTLLMHASVIAKGDGAYLFFGTSGTGKSTHSRLWLENVEGASLLNDDNPALRVIDGNVMAYGTPWSGKTPCYRNLALPVKALVHLHQDKQNTIAGLSPLQGYININTSASCLRWNDSDTDACISVSEKIAMKVPSFELGCLPDADAALVCASAVI